MKNWITLLACTVALCAVALSLSGCGGSAAGSGGSSPQIKTKTSVKNGNSHILLSLAGFGPQGSGQAASTNGTAMAPHGSLPMFGAFILNCIVGPSGSVHGVLTPRLTVRPMDGPNGGGSGSSGGSAGSGGGDITDTGIYYSDYLGLWVENVTVSPTEAKMNLWIDQAKTTSAGAFDSVFPVDFSTFPMVWHSTFAITAGAYKGSNGTDDYTLDSDTAGHSSYQTFWAGQGTYSGSSIYGPSGSTWTNEADNTDGTWYKDSGTFKSDGSGKTSTSSSNGYAFNYTYNADGSGSGTIAGPDPGLPATIVWDALGNVTVTYADGTVDKWNMFSWGPVEPVNGTGGVAGSGSGTVTPMVSRK